MLYWKLSMKTNNMKTNNMRHLASSRAMGALGLGVAVLFLLGASTEVQAYPSSAIGTANSCSVCHGPYNATSAPDADGRTVSGLISVSNFSRTKDLGTQLDGKVRGPLKTFDGAAGGTVTLSVDVVASVAATLANANYALQLKRLEKSGQQNSITNFLGWSDANPGGSGWVKQGTATPYYTKTLNPGATGTFTFTLGLNPTTPVDFYDLEFAIAGLDDTGKFYNDQHYYLAVVSPTLLTDSAVTWSTALTNAGWILEVSTDLTTWVPYTGSSAIIDGTNVVLMKTSEGGKKFFRLRKP